MDSPPISTAQENFFNCGELLLAVTESISSIESDKTRRSTLVAMALTCQTWYRVVVRILWRNVYGFEPILRCLPEDVWDLDHDQYDKNGRLDWNMRLPGRRICVEDTTRFTSIYGSLIKSLSIEQWPKIIVTEHLKSANPETLFPNLRTLNFSCGNAAEARDYLRFLPYIADNHLQELNFDYPGSTFDELNEITLSEAFSQVTTNCKVLKRLTLGTNVDLAQPPHRFSRLLREVVEKNWSACLQELVVRNLKNSNLDYLSTLPNLHSFRLSDLQSLNCIYEYDSEAPSERPLRPKETAFPGLKHLYIDTTYQLGEKSSNLMAVLQYLSPENANLTSLYLHSDPTCSSLDSWAGVIAMIATHCNKDSLTSLTFGDNIDGTIMFDYDVHSRGRLDMSPLFEFHNMKHFCHHVGDAKPVSGTALSKMATAWVNLRKLNLPRFDDPQVDDDRMDCDDLFHILSSLPQLAYLVVSVDLDGMQDWLEAGAGQGGAFGNLEYVEFVNSEIYDVVEFLDFFTLLFDPLPELAHYMGFGDFDMWIEAVALVRDIRSGMLDVAGALKKAVRWHGEDTSECNLKEVFEVGGDVGSNGINQKDEDEWPVEAKHEVKEEAEEEECKEEEEVEALLRGVLCVG